MWCMRAFMLVFWLYVTIKAGRRGVCKYSELENYAVAMPSVGASRVDRASEVKKCTDVVDDNVK